MSEIVGTISGETLTGTLEGDRLTGLGGNDLLIGDDGTDTAVFSGSRAEYRITRLADGTTRVQDLRIGSPDGSDILSFVEYLDFAGTRIANPAYTSAGAPVKFGTEMVVGQTGVTLTESQLIAREDGALEYLNLTVQDAASSGVSQELSFGTYTVINFTAFGSVIVPVGNSSAVITTNFTSLQTLSQPSTLRMPDNILTAYVLTTPDGNSVIRVDSRTIASFGLFTPPTVNVISGMALGPVRNNPEMVQIAENKMLVAWSVSNGAILGRFVDSNGVPLGEQFNLGSSIAGNVPISIIAFENNRYAVAWDRSDDNSSDILIRFFNDTVALGPSIVVNETTLGAQSHTTMTQLANGSLAVVWQDDSEGGTTIRGRMVSETGALLSSEFEIDSDLTESDEVPQITALADGRFAVAWVGDGAIRGQVMNADGTRSGGEFIVNASTGVAVSEVSMATMPDGRFAVSWTEGSGTGSTIRIQYFDPRSSGVTGTGTVLQDVWEGSAYDDTYSGRFGDDWVRGHSGNDILSGDAGKDVLDGGRGSDTLNGGDGNDELNGKAGNDVMNGGANDDLLQGSNGADELLGGDGNDTLNGGADSDYLGGGAGDDTLTGGLGTDAAEGGLGNDTYVIDTLADIIVEQAGEGTDTVRSAGLSLDLSRYGAVEIGIVTGAAAVNLAGNALNNTLTGTSGNNTLDGGGGDDRLEGGAGDDTYVLDKIGDLIVESANAGTDTAQSSAVSISLAAGIAGLTGQINVEHARLTGSANLNLFGSNSANTLNGNSGNNVLDGRAGGDTMAGSLGDDTYIVDVANDIVSEFALGGTDTVSSATLSLDLTLAKFANIENATLTGTASLNLFGTSGANRLTGNSGNNVLDGRGGVDTMEGGGGNDTYGITAGDVVIEFANAGSDTVTSAESIALLNFANIENASLSGTFAVNLTGTDTANVLTGNSGANNIRGAGGADRLTGGTGIDDFEYLFVTDSSLAARDTITDFVAGTDNIDISKLSSTFGGFQFLGTAAFSGGEQVRFFQDAGTKTTTIEIDTGGAIGADMAITLTGLVALTTADFFL